MESNSKYMQICKTMLDGLNFYQNVLNSYFDIDEISTKHGVTLYVFSKKWACGDVDEIICTPDIISFYRKMQVFVDGFEYGRKACY